MSGENEVQPGRYSLTGVIRVTGIDRDTIVQYCEEGLLPVEAREIDRMEFGDELIRTIQHIQFLREAHGINLAGVRMIRELMDEVERLQQDLRFERGG